MYHIRAKTFPNLPWYPIWFVKYSVFLSLQIVAYFTSLYSNVAFKPVATVMHDQESVNTEGEAVMVSGKGRHDPCVLPRAVPIVDAMAALVLVDFYLRNKAIR